MSRLTLDLGVRYEVYSPVDLNSASLFTPGAGITGTTSSQGDYRLGGVMPRVGLAFRLTDHTVVRTSYAIYQFPLPFSLLPVNFAGQGTTNVSTRRPTSGRVSREQSDPAAETITGCSWWALAELHHDWQRTPT